MINRHTYLMLSFAILWSLNSQAAPPAFQLQVSAGIWDNGQTSENFTQLTGAYRYSRGLSRQSSINFNADLSTERFSKTDSKDNHSLLLEGIYNYIPSPGFTKPVYSLVLRQQFETFDNSALDRSDTSLLLVDFFRINEDLSFTGGLEIVESSTDIADTSITGLFAGLDYWLSNNTLVYATLKLQDEEREANLIAAPQTQAAPKTAEQRRFVAGSHQFGEAGFQGGNASSPTQGSGSQSDSDNLFITLGVNYQIDEKQSLDLSFARFHYDTVVDTTIRQLSLDYFFRF